jgi:hypothetical protein
MEPGRKGRALDLYVGFMFEVSKYILNSKINMEG